MADLETIKTQGRLLKVVDGAAESAACARGSLSGSLHSHKYFWRLTLVHSPLALPLAPQRLLGGVTLPMYDEKYVQVGTSAKPEVQVGLNGRDASILNTSVNIGCHKSYRMWSASYSLNGDVCP